MASPERVDTCVRAAETRLLDEHHEMLRTNLRTSAPVVVILVLLFSRGAPWVNVILGGVLVQLIGSAGLVLHRRVEHAGYAQRLRSYTAINFVGGIAWGSFLWLGMPDSTESQLFVASIVPFVLVVNMMEAAPVPRSFQAFHLPFSAVVIAAFATSGNGSARLAAVIMAILAGYVLAMAKVVRAGALERSELTVRNTDLIDELNELNADLERQSTEDGLTRLPNRRALERFLDEAFEPKAPEHPAQSSDVVACYIDLDGFKEINDSRGHAAGDELLRLVASRLISLVPEGAFLGRIGGDEFVTIWPNQCDVDDAVTFANAVVHQLAQPFRLSSGTASIGASTGIATTSAEIATPRALLHEADGALYEAKARGGGCAVVAGQVVQPHQRLS